MHDFTWDVPLRLLVALCLGGVIGFERALRDKPAGYRTNVLICVGSCIFTMASQSLGGGDVDQTRVAAQIVTGVGFLGAGAIIRDAKGIVGLTTAATIWSVAAVGMAVGFSQYALAVCGTIAVLLVLLGFPFIGALVASRRDIDEYRLMIDKSETVVVRVERYFSDAHLHIEQNDYHERGDKVIFAIKALGPQSAHRALRHQLLMASDVTLCELK